MAKFKFILGWGILFLPFAIIVSCNNTKIERAEEEDDEYEVIHAKMRYFDFDKVKDLPSFFDSISSVHGIPRWSPDDDEVYVKGLLKCIERIDAFRKGNSKYFPDSLVRKSVDFLGHECAVIDNHAPGVDMTYAEWFLMLAAYYSPDITCLVHMQSPNHKAGILNFGSTYNFNPWWCYIFFKRSQGYEVRRIGCDETKMDKLFQIMDEDNRLYYLCSNNSSIIEFLQILFWVKDDNEVLMVAECDSLPVDNWDNFEECYYDPQKMVWCACNVDKRTGKMIPVSSKPVLTLKLDGRKSYFIKDE